MGFVLRVEGLAGDARQDNDEVVVQSFEFGASQGGFTLNSEASRTSVQDFVIEMAASEASPRLLLGCLTGTRYRTAMIVASDDNGERLAFRLDDVLITSFFISGADTGTGVRPSVRVGLSFARIVLRVTAESKTDARGPQVVVGWDLAANRPLLGV